MDEAIQRLQAGGESALAELFSEYRPRLERLIEFRLDPRLKSRLDPADVLQDAYLEMARRHQEFMNDGRVSFYVWARQLTVQSLINLQRRHFGQKRSPQNEFQFFQSASESTTGSIAQILYAQLTSPSGAAIRAEEIQLLQEALAGMDDTDREVLALRHFEHMGNSEVAEALGLSTTAASNRYVRAMTRLGEIMQKFRSES